MKTTLILFVLFAFSFNIMYSQDSEICEGGLHTYSVDDADGTAGTPGSSYAWSIVETTFVGNIVSPGAPADTNDIEIDWNTTPAGIYTLEVVETTAEGCTGEIISHTIEVNALPVAPTIAVDPICNGGDGQFLVTGSPEASFFYTLDGGTAISATMDATGEYMIPINGATADVVVEITNVTNASGCELILTPPVTAILTVNSVNTSPITAN